MRFTRESDRRTSEFSLRDYTTGWIHPEVRAYCWRYVRGGEVKHAIERPFQLYERPTNPAFPDVDPRSIDITNYWKGNPGAECGFWPDGPGQWLGSETDRAFYFDLPRCPDCLKAIGAPSVRPLRPHKPLGRKPPGRGNQRLTEDQVREIRAMEGVSPTELGRRYGVSRTSIRSILSGRLWKDVG